MKRIYSVVDVETYIKTFFFEKRAPNDFSAKGFVG